MFEKHCWSFPLSDVDSGIALGNGTLGVRVWGQAQTLCLTLGRADFWDRRGGFEFRKGMTYCRIRELLDARDESGLRQLFEQKQTKKEGEPRAPSVMPVGRLELQLEERLSWEKAELDFATSVLTVHASHPHGAVQILVDREVPVLWVTTPTPGVNFKLISRPAWELMQDKLHAIGIPPVEPLEGGGWFQALPHDPGLAVLIDRETHAGYLRASLALGDTCAEAVERARAVFDATSQTQTCWTRNVKTARQIWEALPQVDLPNSTLAFHYAYGLFRFLGLTSTHGVPATLQGGWIEDDRFPAWSSDYHWNINVQMCYWPAIPLGLPEHYRPLWQMLQGWTQRLQQNALIFAEVEDGRLLPHATDDTGRAMGGFWAGLVDHGCTTWVAIMMADYFRNTRDLDFLRELAMPFMKGTLAVWRKMLDEKQDGTLHLPVSVSPEYKGNRLDAWGANATFQLAAIHRLVTELLEAAVALGEEPDPFWQEIQDRLPLATTVDWPGPQTAIIGPRKTYQILGLWENQLLEESHRHHSHFAPFHPFDTIDFDDPKWLEVLDDTFKHLTFTGMGLWAGCFLPWAAILHARAANPEMAELLLELWDRVFNTPGHGQDHDARFPGFSLMGNRSIGLMPNQTPRPARMQMDQPMAALTAILEMLVHERRGIHYLFLGAPASWQSVSFQGIHTRDGHQISAARQNGVTTFVTVRAKFEGVFRLKNPWPDDPPPGVAETMDERGICHLRLQAGQEVTWDPRSSRHSR